MPQLSTRGERRVLIAETNAKQQEYRGTSVPKINMSCARRSNDAKHTKDVECDRETADEIDNSAFK